MAQAGTSMKTAAVAADPPLDVFLTRQPKLAMSPTLPTGGEDVKAASLLTILKGVIGKDLSNPIPVPVTLAEPASDLIKRAEDMCYTVLLDKAAEEPMGSIDRLLQVVAYALSPYAAAHTDRAGMPLFSAPGETLEAVLPDQGVRFIAEAIFDDGWNICYHAEGSHWKITSDDKMRFSVFPNSMVATPNWFLELTFDDGDMYTWQKVVTTAHNIMTGTKFISHTGSLNVTQQLSERIAVLKFRPLSTFTITTKARKEANRPVEGYILEKGRDLGIQLHGFWDSYLDATFKNGGSKRLWTVEDMASSSNRWKLPAFASKLNKVPEGWEQILPGTDTRLRQDISLMKHAKWVQAQNEKERLEGNCFKTVASAKQNGQSAIPARWFTKRQVGPVVAAGEGIRWRYSRRYWAAREKFFEGEMLPAMFAKDQGISE